MADIISIQPELLYSMKGSEVSGNLFGVKAKYKETLHYIDVPVPAHINAGSLFFEVGPQIGFLAAARVTLDIAGQS